MDVIDLSNPDLAWAKGMFDTAKKILVESNGNVQPMLFLHGADFFDIVPLLPRFPMRNEAEKDEVARFIRMSARERKAIAVGHVADTFRYGFDLKAIRAYGLDITRHHDWPQRFKDKYRTRRDVLAVSACTRDVGVIMQQLYRKEDERIVLEGEEIEKMLSREEIQRAIGPKGLMPRFMWMLNEGD